MRKIVQRPDPILYKVSEPIKSIDSYINELVADMERYLLLSRYVGISAVQLGELVRLIGVKYNREVIFIVNPEITKASSQTYPDMEACVSIHDGKIPFKVVRHKLVKVKGIDLNSQEVTYKGRDMFGKVLQHEIAHLNGHLISDGYEVR